MTPTERRLAEYRDLTYQALRKQLPSREPRRYLYDVIFDQLSRAGKGLRPALCIATCRAFGGSLEQALPSAVSIELLHNAFLVHDDIEDGSLYRRNRAALYVEEGLPLALNVGDAMNALSVASLIENIPVLGAELAYRIFHESLHLILQSVEGQALELGWTRDNVLALDEDDYLRMVLKKTCWYTCIHPCRIGALIGSAGRVDADRFNLFGFLLGAAFQIQDDILNLVGDRIDLRQGDPRRHLGGQADPDARARRPQLHTRGRETAPGTYSPSPGINARSTTWSGFSTCWSGTAVSTSRAPPCAGWSRPPSRSSRPPSAMRHRRPTATSSAS